MLELEIFKESDVIKMTTKAYFSIRVKEQLRRNGDADLLKDVESMPEARKKSAMRVLVPVNGTRECEIPIALARQLAGAVGAEVYLVRVIEWIDAFSGLRFDPDILRMMDDAARYLVELASRLGLPEDRTQPLVSWSDNAAKEIITIAEKEGIDLIIMASRRKGWLQRLVQGNSLCSHLVRSQVCPVLCVPLAPAQVAHRDPATAATQS
jgi:nucleotide-binding universal stress UspA family protein